MTDLILWRHGQTDYNSQGRIQGQVDIPLNETGRDQARRAADGIAALGPTRIVSSPLARARATAEVLASLTGLSVERVNVVVHDVKLPKEESEAEDQAALNQGQA